MNEAIAEKVNQMTKIVMVSTANAWLVHLPGLTRRHEIFTAEQLAQDSLNLEDLVLHLCRILRTTAQHVARITLSLSYCLFTGVNGLSLKCKPGNSLSLV
jgi:hypothetical protein